MAKIKIFYLITKGTPYGGAQKYVFDLATGLSADQFDISVILGEGGELEKKLKKLDVRVIVLPMLNRDVAMGSDWQVFRHLLKLFKTEQPDIIHLNSSKIGGLGALAGRLAGIKKIIFTGHAWAFNEDRPWWQKTIIKSLQWLTVLLSHATIAVSEKTKNDLAHLPWIKNKFSVIHNGVSPVEYLDRSSARRELAAKIWKKGFDQETLDQITVIGTISELHRNKGHDFLIEALGQLKEKLGRTLVWIIGDGEEKENLKALIKKLGLKNQVFLLGSILEAKKYLRAFDIFTLTSRTEALPYALLEAGQAGLPVIASAVGGIPEIVSDFKLGILVRPGNIREIKLAISRLLEKPAEGLEFGKTLAKRINKEFSINKMIDNTIKIYEGS